MEEIGRASCLWDSKGCRASFWEKRANFGGNRASFTEKRANFGGKCASFGEKRANWGWVIRKMGRFGDAERPGRHSNAEHWNEEKSA